MTTKKNHFITRVYLLQEAVKWILTLTVLSILLLTIGQFILNFLTDNQGFRCATFSIYDDLSISFDYLFYQYVTFLITTLLTMMWICRRYYCLIFPIAVFLLSNILFFVNTEFTEGKLSFWLTLNTFSYNFFVFTGNIISDFFYCKIPLYGTYDGGFHHPHNTTHAYILYTVIPLIYYIILTCSCNYVVRRILKKKHLIGIKSIIILILPLLMFLTTIAYDRYKIWISDKRIQHGLEKLNYQYPLLEEEETSPKQMTMTTSGFGASFELKGTGSAVIDWGDGTPNDTVTLSDCLVGTYHSRTYADTTSHSITIAGDSITYLSSVVNKLTALDVSKNSSLKTLICYMNDLTVLDVGKNRALEDLWCSANQLTFLNVSNCKALKHLSCENNQLTVLDVSHSGALQNLWCQSNQLTVLDVSNNLMLSELLLSSNQFSTDALDAIFRTLHRNRLKDNRKYIRIGNNPGTETCNQNLAKRKGWTVNPTM